jgi:hypothetical protein
MIIATDKEINEWRKKEEAKAKMPPPAPLNPLPKKVASPLPSND